MRFSRERVFHLAARMTEELLATDGVVAQKPADDIRTEIIRVLSDEVRVEETIDAEVRKILSSYARPAPEGSPEWEILYRKTREEVFRRRFRLA
ncbi:MAG: DUF507 family protein [Candidatus Rokubacteria bacterium]|nr:DUF507 family protein [Candidatus Rokubacteria bacterium]